MSRVLVKMCVFPKLLKNWQKFTKILEKFKKNTQITQFFLQFFVCWAIRDAFDIPIVVSACNIYLNKLLHVIGTFFAFEIPHFHINNLQI